MDHRVKVAAEKAGGIPELARKLGVSRQAIYQWSGVPLDRIVEVEQITGIAREDLRPDVFSRQADAGAPSAYDSDFHAWLVSQATLLREKKLDEIDLSNLAEEIHGLAKSERRQIESRLNGLLVHLLKWMHQPDHRKPGWLSSIVEQRARIQRILEESPSLKRHPGDSLDREYRIARLKAAGETGLPLSRFPKEPPFTIDQVLDESFPADLETRDE